MLRSSSQSSMFVAQNLQPGAGFAPAPPEGLCFCLRRQLDCLRQLVVVLCERSQLQDLVEFPYVNLLNEVTGLRWEEWERNPSL